MADYGTNAATQILAYGAADSDLDTRSAGARAVATSYVNAYLDLDRDIASPTDFVTDATNLLAAAVLLTGQASVEAINAHPFFDLALKLLEKAKGDQPTEVAWRKTIPVDRFEDRG